MDGVSVVVVAVTDERSEAVGVTIVEPIDGYFVIVGVERELLNCRLSFVVIIESEDGWGGRNFIDESFKDRIISSVPLQFGVDCEWVFK